MSVKGFHLIRIYYQQMSWYNKLTQLYVLVLYPELLNILAGYTRMLEC